MNATSAAKLAQKKNGSVVTCLMNGRQMTDEDRLGAFYSFAGGPLKGCCLVPVEMASREDYESQLDLFEMPEAKARIPEAASFWRCRLERA